MAMFGWCQTSHHGFAPDVDVERGLCPGVTVSGLVCDCPCHKGVEPDFRASVYVASNNFGDEVDLVDDVGVDSVE